MPTITASRIALSDGPEVIQLHLQWPHLMVGYAISATATPAETVVALRGLANYLASQPCLNDLVPDVGFGPHQDAP